MSDKEASVSELASAKLSDHTEEAAKRKPEYVFAQAPYQMEDEISLVDLIQVVLAHKTTLWSVFIGVFIATLLYVLAAPKQYNYETVIELGSYMLPNEEGILSERKFIESLDNSKSKLEKRFITQVLNEAAAEINDLSELKLPKFKVDAPKNGNLLILSTHWDEDGESVLSLEAKIANYLIRDHIVLANEILEQARQRKNNYKLELKGLTAEVSSLKQQDGVLTLRVARTEQEKMLYQKQLERLGQDIKNLVNQKAAYIADRTSPRDAMAILLLDNELKLIRDHRDELEIELHIALEDRKADLEKALADNRSEIEVAQATEDNVRSILSRFNIDSVVGTLSSTAEKNPVNKEQKNQFQLIRPTQVVVNPNRSIKPVGMGRSVKLMIGLIAGGVLALLACFMAELVSKVRTETRRENENVDDGSSSVASV